MAALVSSKHPLHAYLDDAEQLLLTLLSEPDICQLLHAKLDQGSSNGPNTPSSSESKSDDAINSRTPDPVLKRLRDLVSGFVSIAEGRIDLYVGRNLEGDDDESDNDTSGFDEGESGCVDEDAISPVSSHIPPAPPSAPHLAQVVIIGASASGLGVAKSILSANPDLDLMIVEATSSVGASFRSWPSSTRFISPSFYSNPFNQIDLNGLSPIDDNGVQAFLRSRPGKVVDAQHPTGHEYADYLDHFASTPLKDSPSTTLKDFVSFDTTVNSIESVRLVSDKGAFKLSVSSSSSPSTIYARYVIYAGGEYGHPYMPPFALEIPEACVHYSKVDDWGEGAEGNWVVIGAGEAGIDAALALYDNISCGEITVIDKNGGNTSSTSVAEDPSTSLTPRTLSRLKAVLESKENPNKSLRIISNHVCVKVEASFSQPSIFTAEIVERGSSSTARLESPHRIIMATGFKLSTSPNCVLKDLVDWDDTGRPVLDPACDQSTKNPGLFVVGPMVKHITNVDCEESKERSNEEDVIFCFIYKFRCRFALVAGEILSRLVLDYNVENGVLDDVGKDTLSSVSAMMELYKDKGMLITDLSRAVCGEIPACGASC